MPESVIDVKDTEIKNVGVRIYTPQSGEQKHRPGIIYFHGGGFALGDPGKLLQDIFWKLAAINGTISGVWDGYEILLTI